MKDRDFQTLSLFAILGLLTVGFVLLSRAVLFAPNVDRGVTSVGDSTGTGAIVQPVSGH